MSSLARSLLGTAAVTIGALLVTASPSSAQEAEIEHRFARATAQERAGDVETALAAYDALVKLDPDDWRLRVARGGARFRTGDVAGSMEDFDKAIELEPTQEPQLWQRGISLYYLGRYRECADQFELHRTVNPDDVENAAWHFLCQVRASELAVARQTILPVGPDSRRPMAEIYELFSGRATVDRVLAAVARVDASERELAEFYAYLYVGLYFEALGLDARSLESIEHAAGLGLTGYMPDVARVHRLQRTEPP